MMLNQQQKQQQHFNVEERKKSQPRERLKNEDYNNDD